MARAGVGLPPAFVCRRGVPALVAVLLLAAVPARLSRAAGWAPADSLARAAAPRADTLVRAAAPRADTLAHAAALSAGAAAPFATAADSVRPVFDYLWVVRTGLLSPEAVDEVVERGRQQHVRGLLVQVVGRGDAYYRSDLLPRSEALPENDFDPLGRLVERAHAAGLEVHAWMNCMLVWSAPQMPRDPHHVVLAHPEWIARMKDGRRLSQLSFSERQRLGIEGIFLAPAHPSVRTWLANVAQEIVTRYPVDGLHLDYIRQPKVEVGWDPTTRERFALQTGVDPDRFDHLPAEERARVDSLWLGFQSEQVRAVVAEVRDSVRAKRPDLPLTAAVLADTLTAERHTAQNWKEWLRTGLLDRVFVMCYAEPVQTVMDQLVGYRAEFGPSDRVVPGISVYNTPPSSAAAKIRGARAMGFPLLAGYSYQALLSHPGYWLRLKRDLDHQHGSSGAAHSEPRIP